MRAADLDAVLRIAAVVHADLPESRAVLAERLALYPAGCLMTEGGYAIAHPARPFHPPALDTLLGALPADAACLHVHDVALLPARQGGGRGAAAIARFAALAAAEGLGRLSLIAVHGTGDYWRRHGFAPAAVHLPLGSYGAGAVYMIRALPRAGPALRPPPRA